MEGMTDVGSKIKYRPEFMKWEQRQYSIYICFENVTMRTVSMV